MSEAQAMRIDHFEGADGPTIWFDVDASRDLASLLSIFRSLASGGDVGEVDLCTALPARIENLGGLRLRVEERTRLPRKRLVKTRSYERPSLPGPRLSSFVWSNSGSGWNRCAEIVEELIRRDHPGRRDLTVRGVDDALVDLSFRATSAAAMNGSRIARGSARLHPQRKRVLNALGGAGRFAVAIRTACAWGLRSRLPQIRSARTT